MEDGGWRMEREGSCAWGERGWEKEEAERRKGGRGWGMGGGECAVVWRGMALLQESNMRDASVWGYCAAYAEM